MAANKTTSKAQRAARLDLVARMYLQKYRIVDIAKKAGVTFQQISYDLKAVRKLWLESAARDFDEAKSQELAKIDTLEEQYWESWHKSMKDKNITTKGKESGDSGDKSKISVREEERDGDPRYLQGVQWCINKRCEILGFEAPKKSEVSGPGGGPIHMIDSFAD